VLVKYPKEYQGVLYFADESFGKGNKMIAGMTVQQAFEKKLELEAVILELVQKFEYETGLLVTSIIPLGEEDAKTDSVQIAASL
jgi:hypothetical protein